MTIPNSAMRTAVTPVSWIKEGVKHSQVAKLVDAAVMILLKGVTPQHVIRGYCLNISRVNQLSIIVKVQILL